jgi:lipoyl(octanoyl) transferase
LEARGQGQVPDVLLLLEHSPVVTLGRGAKPQNVVASPEVLARAGVSVVETNRGGDVTYHGPGQVVGYPIFQLEGARQDVRRYVRDLEEAMIRTCARFGVQAGRIPNWTGVWVGEGASARKIGAIGVHLTRWRTSHGFALNVNTELSGFELIVPCGIREAGVTSLKKELGHPVDMREVEAVLAQTMGELFDAPLQPPPPPVRTVCVVVTEGTKILLLKRTAADGGFWQPVTGRIESGETPEEAARRELGEETGARTDVVSLDYVHSFAFGESMPPQLALETAFRAEWPGGEVVVDPNEHDAFAWVSIDEAVPARSRARRRWRRPASAPDIRRGRPGFHQGDSARARSPPPLPAIRALPH